jgi:hypothetical protein
MVRICPPKSWKKGSRSVGQAGVAGRATLSRRTSRCPRVVCAVPNRGHCMAQAVEFIAGRKGH